MLQSLYRFQSGPGRWRMCMARFVWMSAVALTLAACGGADDAWEAGPAEAVGQELQACPKQMPTPQSPAQGLLVLLFGEVVPTHDSSVRLGGESNARESSPDPMTGRPQNRNRKCR